ncbi:MAG: PPOX class F420-dependent oxidoreductase [Anaerolineae bacterium]
MQIPEEFQDLIERPIVATLVTLMPDHQPQATPVWFSYDGEHFLINTARGRQKDRNMVERPQVTLLIVDHDNPYRWLEVRGRVDAMTEEGAVEHINSLSARYFDREDYYAGNEDRRNKETRVIFKIRPTHINGTNS